MSNNYPDKKRERAEGTAIRVLAVDTSSTAASYAITEGEQVLAALSTSAGARQSQTFFANLETLLQLADLELNRIEALAVATGPGSFTGLRVGLAAVKGLAYTLGRPSIGVDSIEAQALAAGVAGLVLVMIEAGRGEVYAGLRRIGPEGEVEKVERDRVGEPSRLLAELGREIPLYNKDNYLAVVGDGARRHRAELESYASREGIELKQVSHFTPFDSIPNSWQLKTGLNHDCAVAIGRRASRLIESGIQPPVLAYYIRQSDAEIKRRD